MQTLVPIVRAGYVLVADIVERVPDSILLFESKSIPAPADAALIVQLL